MGTTMNHPACEWVRGRLPLWRGPLESAGDPDGDGDGGDLDAAERRAIERHLAACTACRAHRSGLSRAFEALGAAAAAVPAGPEGPSLWPSLERRIAAHVMAGASRPREQDAAGRLEGCAALDAERPLRTAWMQDTLKEGFADSILGGLGEPGSSATRVLGASLAASILLLVVMAPALWRRQSAGEARIQHDSHPAAGLVQAPLARPSQAAVPPAHVAASPQRIRRHRHRRDLPAGQLAQADLNRLPAVPAPAPAAAAAAAGASEPKSGTITRIGYDLEPVTPMPPDGRDSEAVY
jgi:hypothetical protein